MGYERERIRRARQANHDQVKAYILSKSGNWTKKQNEANQARVAFLRAIAEKEEQEKEKKADENKKKKKKKKENED